MCLDVCGCAFKCETESSVLGSVRFVIVYFVVRDTVVQRISDIITTSGHGQKIVTGR